MLNLNKIPNLDKMLVLIRLRELLDKANNYFNEYKQLFFELLAISLNKTQNLAKTNFDLGMHHLNQGNIIDAKLRFKMVKSLFGGFPSVDYHIARCYIYEQNLKKALNYLALDEPLAIYRRNVIEKREINYIPLEVIIEDFDFYANSDSHNLSTLAFANSVLSRIVELKEISELTNILDLGCGRGAFGTAIEQTFTHSFTIEALDISANMINYCKTLLSSKNLPVYNNFYIRDYKNFHNESDKKYDLVIANLSLHYSTNLAENLNHITSLITQKGFVLLTLYTSLQSTSFDYELQNFAFSEDYIRVCAAENNLNLIEINYSPVNENKNLVYCILKAN
jgi:predicted TPR repeat methyltransferase